MGGQGGGPRRGARRHTRAVRFAGRPLDNSESQTGLPYLATTSETERRARCAAAPRSEFRACERAEPIRCGASCTFILSLQCHGRKKVGSLRSAICLLAADV